MALPQNRLLPASGSVTTWPTFRAKRVLIGIRVLLPPARTIHEISTNKASLVRIVLTAERNLQWPVSDNLRATIARYHPVANRRVAPFSPQF